MEWCFNCSLFQQNKPAESQRWPRVVIHISLLRGQCVNIFQIQVSRNKNWNLTGILSAGILRLQNLRQKAGIRNLCIKRERKVSRKKWKTKSGKVLSYSMPMDSANSVVLWCCSKHFLLKGTQARMFWHLFSWVRFFYWEPVCDRLTPPQTLSVEFHSVNLISRGEGMNNTTTLVEF